jgi:hypothetical protein
LKDLVSDRYLRAAGSIGALLLLGAVVVSPGAPSMDYLPIGGLAMLVVTTTVMCLGRLAPAAAMARVIHDVDAERAPGLSSAAKRRGIR